MINRNDLLNVIFTSLSKGIVNAKMIFFKMVQPMNKCLHLLLYSFIRSWTINTRWSI